MLALLNETNPVVRQLRDYCASDKPLTGTVADVLHEIYHMAQAYRDPRLAESDHYFEHKNRLLQQLLDAESERTKLQTERDQLSLKQADLMEKLEQAERELEQFKSRDETPGEMQSQDCALLLTDLSGSTRMVGFAESTDSAYILQKYAHGIQKLVRKFGGRVEKFTGDGIFAYFGPEIGDPRKRVSAAKDCALRIKGLSDNFFLEDEIQQKLIAGIGTCDFRSRTVLHYASVMVGDIGGARSLVGKPVVALFRCCDRNDLFEDFPVIMSHPFFFQLALGKEIQPLKKDVVLDESLPPLTFYPHPSFAK